MKLDLSPLHLANMKRFVRSAYKRYGHPAVGPCAICGGGPLHDHLLRKPTATGRGYVYARLRGYTLRGRRLQAVDWCYARKNGTPRDNARGHLDAWQTLYLQGWRDA